MTIFHPNLRVDRLVVFGRGERVFDERFHSGLNIIRGENSSGKSTIMDFLFYGLGGDLFDWREIALNCESIFLQASVNEKAITLSREIVAQPVRPMRIYIGEMEDALGSAADGWEVFPYSRGSKDSFSQVLFRFLGLPEVQTGESQSKITMNQILRLLYADQISPIDRIFRLQQFDDAVTRQTVGDLLCGAFSDKFYRAVIRSSEASKELAEVVTKIRSTIAAHSRGRTPLTREWLEAETVTINEALSAKNAEIERLENDIFHAQFDDRLTLNDQEETYKRIVQLQAEIASIEEDLNTKSLEQADSAQFISAIDRRLFQLQNSYAVIEEFDRLDFQFCPSCLEPVEAHGVEGACTLCKEPFDKSRTRSRSLKLINEFSRQREQSLELQNMRDVEMRELRSKLASVKELWAQANRHYSVSVKTPTTEIRANLRRLNREAGYLIKQLEELAGKSEVISQIEQLSTERETLQQELDLLKAVIENENTRTRERVSAARQKIEAITIEFLKADLSRQSTFDNARSVDFEFDGNRIAVNGDSFFSASSMVYLKNSFLAAFLYAAANDPLFSHPRILIMDTVEDKGMEPGRSKNFQKLLRDMSDIAKSEHQIIIATSMIAEELNDPKYTVGEYYTHTNRTLKVRA
ncbi:chromosome segregation ATPase [Agrobacterium tumefaciens]|uniref:Chromosome segregation ATPase n=1 Tax=Agrobacterium tumefaciens TaxID=358 RepID=A0AAW8M193_AGRTU|nr:ATP-binding protein [Agrobacterium tumefaciens]MBP2568169.1 chromosome segregation ATPase [Agrobacterium tumefaciens]MDR6705153.1 chromosome segregation ATPase [Agrobacterium tumefaciens]